MEGACTWYVARTAVAADSSFVGYVAETGQNMVHTLVDIIIVINTMLLMQKRKTNPLQTLGLSWNCIFFITIATNLTCQLVKLPSHNESPLNNALMSYKKNLKFVLKIQDS